MKNHAVLKCKCHGISDSCAYRTCWKTMAPFDVVGSFLRHRYHHGVQVTVDQNSNELLSAKGDFSLKPSSDDLVFLEEFPDYCVPIPDTGSLGTTGRICNQTAQGPGSCGILCCQRGFNTIQIEEEFKCNCKLHWCCQVNCNTCRRTVDRHVCKSPEEANMVKNNQTSRP